MSFFAKSVSTEYSITRTVLYCCLAFFPFIIMYVEMERFFAIEIADQRSQVFERAGRELRRFSEYAEDARFFHLLLRRSFAATTQRKTHENQLISKSENLKKVYPGTFSFMFWDKNGNPITAASDDTRFSFLSKRLNVFLGKIRLETISGLHTEADFNEKHDRDLRMLRQFLGPFATPDGLVKPFLPDDSAACFQLHARGDKVLGWYAAYEDFSVLVFISDKTRGRLTGPEFLQKQLTGRIPGIDFILIDEQQQKLFPAQTQVRHSKILLNLDKFRKLVSAEQLESEGEFFNFQKLNRNWWVTAVMSRKCFASISKTTGSFMAKILVCMALTAFILYCYFLIHVNPFHSVKSKLVVIFAYIVFIPALVFTVVSLDYLKQKEKQIVADTAVAASQHLTAIDNQFNPFLHAKALKLNRTFAKLFPGGSGSFNEEFLASAAAFIDAEFKPDTFLFADRSGSDLLKGTYAKTIKDAYLRRTATAELLSYLNCKATGRYNPDDGVANGFARSFAANHQKFMPFALSNTNFISYLNTLRSSETAEFSNVIQLFWPEKQIQQEYLKAVSRVLPAEDHKQLCFAMSESGGIFPEMSHLPDMPSFFEKVKQQGSSHQIMSAHDGKNYTAFGQSGTSLNTAVMAVIIDNDSLYGEIDQLRKKLVLLAVLSLLMTVSLFHILAYYLISPINALATGVEMIKQRNYSYRIALPFKNEFGYLGRSIDESLENLQELEIARTVQESLIPQQSLAFAPFSVIAKTRAMTSLGGDYFDFVVDDENNLTVLMADVAGHGVQAGLLMAMAKSVLLLKKSKIEPEKLMTDLNRTFCNLRKASISTMMTGQIIHITHDCDTSFFNAGHCPPLIISENGRSSRLLECESLPFGFSAKRVFAGMPTVMQPGETIILYSDGILECNDRNKKILGHEGFNELAVSAWHENIDIFLDNLFRAYEGLTSSQQDDITFVLIRRSKAIV